MALAGVPNRKYGETTLKLISTKHWSVNDAEGFLFFAQRLTELLFDYTLDTYKPPALNVVALCHEALSVLADVESNIIDPANVDHVLRELEWAIKNDSIAKKLLDADVGYYILSGEEVSRSEQKIRLEVLAKTLNPRRYSLACESRLAYLVGTNKKAEIDQVVRSYVSGLVNFGISKSFLADGTRRFFFDEANKITSLDQIGDFFDSIHPVSHTFTVYFKIDSLIKQIKESNSAFGVKVLESLPEKLLGFARDKGFVLGPGECIVEISDINAVDPYSAREDAEQRLDRLSDLFMFFSHRSHLKWSDEAILTRCCTDEPAIAGKPLSSMSKGQDVRPVYAAGRLNQLIENFSLRGGSIKKFTQAVDLHGMALRNDVPSNQLLNIWIALETVVPSHRGGGSTVAKITNGLMPFLLEGYVRRLVLNLTKDLFRWNRRLVGTVLSKIEGGGKAQHKVLKMLILPECSERKSEIYAELADFPLLKYRMYSLSEKLADPKKVLATLITHKTKVEWQIRRIYRTRNLVVHSGDEPSFIGTLIENSHDYLDVALTNIIELSCKEYGISSLEQAFELGKIRYERFERFLRKESAFSAENILQLYG